MLNPEIAKAAALITSGALQSGQLPVDEEHAAEYYMKLYELIAEKVCNPAKRTASADVQDSINRVTEDPNEVY